MMTQSPAQRGGIRLRSSGLGRERWDVPPLYRRPLLAEAVERELCAVAGVTRVNANPVTGRILVHFDPRRLRSGRLKSQIEKAVKQSLVQALDAAQFDQDEPFEELEPSFAVRTAGRLLDEDLVAVLEQSDALGGNLKKPVALSTLDAWRGRRIIVSWVLVLRL